MFFEREIFCRDYNIAVSLCDIVTSENVKVLRKFVNDCNDGSSVKLSFESEDGKLTQLSMMGGKHFIIFSPGVLLDLSNSPALPILKELFEDRTITKHGENSWLLILIMLKDYEVWSRSFRAIGMLQREHKPLTDKNLNLVWAMFETARMLMATFSNIYKTTKESQNLLNVTTGNKKALMPLLNHLIEIDHHRSQLLLSEWELRVKSMNFSDCGRKLNIQQEKSKNRLRHKSHVVISTVKGDMEGYVLKKHRRFLHN